jgi:hypothetical protein
MTRISNPETLDALARRMSKNDSDEILALNQQAYAAICDDGQPNSESTRALLRAIATDVRRWAKVEELREKNIQRRFDTIFNQQLISSSHENLSK